MLAFFVCSSTLLQGQRVSADLSEAEIDSIRDAAMDPPMRVLAFQRIVDTRVDRLQRVLVDVRAQGRAEDLHHNMGEIANLVNELEDTLDDYAQAHKDLRKVLPKLVVATDRWASVVRQPPANERYDLGRKLALEALADLKDSVEKLLPEQQAYFKADPPAKEPLPSQFEVPR